jgi:hypothetical protein
MILGIETGYCITALCFVSAFLFFAIIMPALIISGRISERERKFITGDVREVPLDKDILSSPYFNFGKGVAGDGEQECGPFLHTMEDE